MEKDVEMYIKMFSKLAKASFEVVEICTDEKCVRILEKAMMEADDIFIAYHE